MHSLLQIEDDAFPILLCLAVWLSTDAMLYLFECMFIAAVISK